MVRTQIQLTEEQAERVRRVARERGASIATVIRDAIDAFVAAGDDHERRAARALALVGKYADREGANDVSTAHDTYLAAAFADSRP